MLLASSLNRNIFPQQFHIAGNLGDVAQLEEDREGNPSDSMTMLSNSRDCPTGNKSQKRKRKKVNNTFQFKNVCEPLFRR